ncbi:LemA family protein [Priestia megaterium]|uniref:LemA family protein n=1 Tax=Priestia megaterium TaxID=1404 RepID=UPI0024535D83|nr:LemA family protein [Priestia megaterium]MDH3141494.1 LemA family protein [Priestia megaterium]MED4237368.1 LemA family protein [Priestia megaterium]MED4266435.1 LemA family protein [Priestia megaterium]MED4275758.1 LemA family protein [Priestia megaterium]MED4314930.1 LemA family protein [Priestia megaterium]
MKNKGLIATLIGIAIVVILGLGIVVIYGVSSYNSLVSAQEDVDNKFFQIDNQLKRRSDLIPNLVETVKGYAKHEQEAIDSVTQARAQLAGAKTPEDKADANQQLSGALNRLLVVVEKYPDLKANENFRSLMDSLEGTENRLAVARKDYNDEVAKYNKSVKRFPKSMLAGTFGFEKKPYFEVTNEEKEAPKVDFGSDK